MTVELEEIKRAVYEAVFDRLEGLDCLGIDDPARCCLRQDRQSVIKYFDKIS